MACSPEALERLDAVLSKIPLSRWKKMFGEVGIYLDEKFVAIFAEDDFFVKVTEGWDGAGCDHAPPYPGASLCWLLPLSMWQNVEGLAAILRAPQVLCPSRKRKSLELG